MDHILPGVSVLICTHNGSRNLPETIRHLAGQQVAPDFSWEIILVNNASTDDTREVAGQLLAALMPHIPCRIVDEPRPGKDRAVDTGLALAHYQYVLICDDDNWLDPQYVQRAFEVMHSGEGIGMLGGRGIPVFESTPAPWFQRFEHYYAVGAQNPVSGEVSTSKGFLWGAGAVLNKCAYQRLLRAGFKRFITYDHCPDIARGEDVELCLAIRMAGYKIWYDEQLIFRHYINAQKITWEYVTKLAKEAVSTFFWLKEGVKRIASFSFCKGWVYNQLHAGEGDKNYVRNLGRLYGALSYFRFNFRINDLVRDTYQLKERLE
jgi:glycosyltransferase involved in cell wall biosynthesis